MWPRSKPNTTNMPDPAPLQPCPFCANPPEGAMEIDQSLWAVVCPHCHTIGPHATTPQAAQTAWNEQHGGTAHQC